MPTEQQMRRLVAQSEVMGPNSSDQQPAEISSRYRLLSRVGDEFVLCYDIDNQRPELVTVEPEAVTKLSSAERECLDRLQMLRPGNVLDATLVAQQQSLAAKPTELTLVDDATLTLVVGPDDVPDALHDAWENRLPTDDSVGVLTMAATDDAGEEHPAYEVQAVSNQPDEHPETRFKRIRVGTHTVEHFFESGVHLQRPMKHVVLAELQNRPYFAAFLFPEEHHGTRSDVFDMLGIS